MKKILSIIIIAASALLCACGNVAEIPVATAVPDTSGIAADNQGELETVSDDDFTVFIARFATETRSYEDPAGNGIEILSYSVCTPSVEVIGSEAVSDSVNSAIRDINAPYFRTEEGGSTEIDRETEMLAMAEDNYAYYVSGTEEPADVKFGFSRTAEIADADGASFILRFTNTIEANGTEIETEYYRFSTDTGEYEILSEEQVDITTGLGSVDKISMADYDGGGDILDLVVIDENGEDFLYGPAKGKTVYNVNISSLWFCNRMENNFVQVREKS